MMTLATFSLQTALIPFVIGIVVLVLAVALVAWNASARGACSGPETVIFSRSPAKLLGGGVVFAVAVFAIPFVGIDSNNGIFLALFFVALFALVWCGQFLLPTLMFYVADHEGLSRQILGFKKTLPWHTIDWVYASRKTTSYRAYGIVKMGQSTQESVVAEAGARRQIKIVVKAWLVAGDAKPLLAAVQQRATSAQFGFDKQPFVYQRRGAGGAPRR